ncbi:MAG TPA: potassium channel family protein [Geobacterales bacterium]|nr:potassium channel family protein [Geobacterales bacterium]
MEQARLRLRIYVTIFAAVMLIGTLGFSLVEERSLLDSLYFTIVTMATVGYGDIHPLTSAGKLLTLFIIIGGVSTFLAVVANATENFISRRERQSRQEKLQMIIGIFFSEAGTRLLQIFATAGHSCDEIRPELLVKESWGEKEYQRASERVRSYPFRISIEAIDLPSLRSFLASQRELLVRLIENPYLIEHEAFTDILMAILHLREELESRDSFTGLPHTDYDHLSGDMQRIYGKLVLQWLAYLQHLQGNYPFLFSLATRKNPFDTKATAIIGTN